MAEQGAGQGVVGIAEIRMVEDVEELGSEAKAHLFSEVKLPLQGKIRLRCSETPKHIASEIALLSNWRRRKSCLIENLAAGVLRTIEHQRDTWV